ncbi:MAG TPA: glycosyltransferase family 1 protein [Gemmatimonadales bacterium]|nr:glycosyltransferase family 1 protein [Gemmatimonadales bacterium]
MRIGIDVHVVNGPPQGTASVWHALLPSLPPVHEYCLYSFDPAVTARLFPGRHFVHRRIPLRPAPLRIPLVYPWLARRDGCECFHVNYYGPWVGMRGLVVSIHDVIHLDFPAYAPPGGRWRMALLGRASARAARCVTTVSEYSRSRIIARFGVPAAKIAVVPNALGPAWLEPAEGLIAAAWDRLRPSLPERFVLAVGRLDPRKGFPLAARVARGLKRLGLVDGLVVVGSDDFGADGIRRRWEADGTSDLVVRLQNLETAGLQALYRRAACLLFLSLAEGFGLPVLEAMAMGTPVVASNRTAVPEVCGDAAALVDPADEEAVLHTARAILTDPAARDELVARGRRRVGRYTAEFAARRLLDVYRRATA